MSDSNITEEGNNMHKFQCTHIKGDGKRCGVKRNAHPFTDPSTFTCEHHGNVHTTLPEKDIVKGNRLAEAMTNNNPEAPVVMAMTDPIDNRPPTAMGVTEFDIMKDVGGDPRSLHQQHKADGGHDCDLSYPGLAGFLRIRYIGDRMPITNGIPDELKAWMKKVDYKGKWVTVLDFSYAYGITRKGNVVRVHGLEPQIHTVARDPRNMILSKLNAALRAEGKRPLSDAAIDLISTLY